MFRERLREYFSFTRKERIGVLLLIFLILLIFIFPYFFSLRKNKSEKQSLEQFKKEIAQLKVKQQNDEIKQGNRAYNSDDENNSGHDEPETQNKPEKKSQLFYFDPNTISEDQWEQLGIRDKTIRTIQHYLAKGGRFKIPTDLKKIYGIKENDYARLLPFVQIKNYAGIDNAVSPDKTVGKIRSPFFAKTNDFPIIDINTADSISLIALRGIGSKLASRIIHFRERLGGFYTIEQVAEVYGLPDSTFRKIKPFLTIKNDSVNKIDINTADVNTLKQHPYIRWELARSIVQYRSQHGPFKKPEDMLQIDILPPETYKKITSYIKIN